MKASAMGFSCNWVAALQKRDQSLPTSLRALVEHFSEHTRQGLDFSLYSRQARIQSVDLGLDRTDPGIKGIKLRSHEGKAHIDKARDVVDDLFEVGHALLDRFRGHHKLRAISSFMISLVPA